MEVLIVILFIIVIYQGNKIDELKKQINRLRKELKKYKQQVNLTNNSNQNVNVEQTSNADQVITNAQNVESATVKSSATAAVKTQVKPKPKVDPIASRNLSILITGSILIVLAAVAFLTTTWYSVPNFVKTLVLFLLAFVFIGASKISKEKYHLEKASKTFFYIGMAYLPICFLSVSIFGLLGNYLSIAGEGKFIYLGISTVILSLLYYFISKISNDKYIFYGSLLSQILSVIILTLVFEERLFLVCINLLLYNLLLMLVTKDKIFENIINVLPIVILAVSILNIPNAFILGNLSWYFIITCLLVSINFLILELKSTNPAKAIAFNSFLYMFVCSLIFKMNFKVADLKCELLIILFTVLITIALVLLAEGIGLLTYKLLKMDKEIKANTDHFQSLAECFLKLTKSMPNVDVVEDCTTQEHDFDFPSKEGF